MKPNIRSIVQKIIELRSRFSSEELSEAVKLLRQASSHEELLALFEDGHTLAHLDSNKLGRIGSRRTLNQDLQRIQVDDPEKYDKLIAFRTMVMNKEVLPTLEELRTFGMRIRKDFRAGKSRAETIPRIIRLLLDLSKTELENLLESLPAAKDAEGDGYLRLANQIIRGR